MRSINLIAELEDAIAKKSAQTSKILHDVTDLFLVQAGALSADSVAVYDDVFSRLIEEIETAARAELANRLAQVSGSPKNTIRTLALDDNIAVAEPVLAHSSDLSDDTLTEVAATKGQRHLLAVANRATVSQRVSDQLVQRGEAEVLGALVSNTGAAISNKGFELLVEKSTGIDWLATAVGSRKDIPKRHFCSLISRASELVVQKLKAENPQYRGIIEELNSIMIATKDDNDTNPADYRAADLVGTPLVKSGEFTEITIKKLAEARKVEEAIDAIACLASLPIQDVEQLIIEPWSAATACVLKSIGVHLDTLNAIYYMRLSKNQAPGPDLHETKLAFLRLSSATAERVMRMYKVRRNGIR